MTNVVLPELESGKKIVLFFSGGINSTLLAYLAKVKYGVDNVIPVFNGFSNIRQIEALANSTIPSDVLKKERAERLLQNKIDTFYALYNELGLKNAVVLDTIEKYNFDIHNLIGDMHRVNYIEATAHILNQNFGYPLEDIQYVMSGHEKLDGEICALNELDANDGVINNISLDEIKKHVEDNPSQFTEVIKHNVFLRWNEWSYSNGFYKLDRAQFADTDIVSGALPFEYITKTEIAEMYNELGLDELLSKTISCHTGINYPEPCGECIACIERDIALNNVSSNTSPITS